jgi:MFS family permease
MAADAGIEETDHSIIFVMISASTLIAAILYKVLGVYKLLPKHHTILIISCLEMVIFSVVMVYMKTKISQCIALSILKFFNYYFVVSAYICTMIVPPKEEVGLWMSLSHGAFGFLALAGPIIVGFLGQKMYFVVAAACLIITPFFYFMKSPEDIEKTA